MPIGKMIEIGLMPSLKIGILWFCFVLCGVNAKESHEFVTREELIAWLRKEYAKPSKEWPPPLLAPGIVLHELSSPKVPDSLPDMGRTEEKQQLGHALFFDTRLSGSQRISCSHCHDPEKGWGDSHAASMGESSMPLKRNTPGLLGVSHMQTFFWDGRAASLEEQARMVILSPQEMGGNPEQIVVRLSGQRDFYPPLFKAAFGDPEITFERVIQALAAFLRGLTVGRSDFDKFLSGTTDALNDSALSGLHLFRTQARCMNCHNGPMFTDYQFHNVGLTSYKSDLEDLGRYDFTKKPEDVGKFKTPSLRNVTRTGPWTHNGQFSRLRGLLNLYNAGMPASGWQRPDYTQNDPLYPVTSPLLRRLNLSPVQLADLEEFLKSLEEPCEKFPEHPLPPPVSGKL